MANATRFGLLAMALSIFIGAGGPGCAADEAPGGVRKGTKTDGPTVVFDLTRKPLPEIPLPNDIATWPDPTSRTGRRINASLVAPTQVERNARTQISKLEGFSTFGGISVPFDKPLDTDDIKKRHADDDFDFTDDVIYVVNLKTGVPIPLDIGSGNYPLTLRETARYWPNDPAKGEANILFETREEDKNGNGILDPGEDTDFDGVLDHPNFPNKIRPENGVDGLLTFYEHETNTLIARPMIPMEEMTEYAVVVTDRLHGVDKDKKPVQSAFEYIHHPAQRESAKRLAELMARHPEYYGFQGNPIDHVQFVFTFTTQPTVSDMFAMRDGAYGKGKLGWIGNEYPAQIKLLKASGRVEAEDDDPAGWETSTDACKQQGGGTRFIAKFTPAMKGALKDVVEQVFGFKGPTAKRLVDSFDSVAYIAVGTIKVPWLLGDVKNVAPDTTIQYDPATGTIPHSDDVVPFFIVVPKETAEHKQPFPVSYYGHGYTSSGTEALGFSGELARHGIATIGLNAPGHGLEISEGDVTLARALFGGSCLQPFASAFTKGRVRDLNGDGVIKDESGRDYWTAYLFHTRDVVRQAALEEVLVTRALRMFDGTTKYDWDGDGVPDLAGDFDKNGTPDIGGPTVNYYAWGGSLGGILSSLAGGVDPYITATAPMAGGGALTDVGVRSFQGGVVEAIDLRAFGPLIVSVPAESRFDYKKNTEGKVLLDKDGKPIVADKDQQTKTHCDRGQKSIRWVVVDLNDDKEFEIACVNPDEFAEGFDVLVGNMTNGEVRCAQVTKNKSDSGEAEFRIGIPASAGDEIIISSYKPPTGSIQAVETYGKSCKLMSGAQKVKQIDKWSGFAKPCEDGAGECVSFQTARYKLGTKLVAISEGYGIRRQTPDFRKFMQLAQLAVDPADPVNFAPYYYLKQKFDPDGKPAKPTGILTINTIGDMNVPVNTGITAARIHGAIPFLKPTNVAAKDYPDYVAPDDLIAIWGMTPNKMLLQNHVIEGIARLGRHPAGPSCAPNNSALEGCSDKDKTYPAGSNVCTNALFDPEDLSDGTVPFQPQRPAKPLRLARLAKPAVASDVASTWGPRISVAKGGAWTPTGPLGSVLNAYVVPEGRHGFDPPDPCKVWDEGSYLVNALSHFFATGATDLFYLTHPKEHQCLAATDPDPAKGGCVYPKR